MFAGVFTTAVARPCPEEPKIDLKVISFRTLVDSGRKACKGVSFPLVLIHEHRPA